VEGNLSQLIHRSRSLMDQTTGRPPVDVDELVAYSNHVSFSTNAGPSEGSTGGCHCLHAHINTQTCMHARKLSLSLSLSFFLSLSFSLSFSLSLSHTHHTRDALCSCAAYTHNVCATFVQCVCNVSTICLLLALQDYATLISNNNNIDNNDNDNNKNRNKIKQEQQ
jgi:hypothetical protein